ncbi:hypothetical protein EYF80_031421 [Liparis tanakae]|uniref:Uncharacterized protein n=1 Tax=Liparis tanakae TaxID=230148 RepID=A0A4Z2GXP1_9TELE|nr:hypothetical protein EYF80_031421 [Liparis tanakae]
MVLGIDLLLERVGGLEVLQAGQDRAKLRLALGALSINNLSFNIVLSRTTQDHVLSPCHPLKTLRGENNPSPLVPIPHRTGTDAQFPSGHDHLT